MSKLNDLTLRYASKATPRALRNLFPSSNIKLKIKSNTAEQWNIVMSLTQLLMLAIKARLVNDMRMWRDQLKCSYVTMIP